MTEPSETDLRDVQAADVYKEVSFAGQLGGRGERAPSAWTAFSTALGRLTATELATLHELLLKAGQ